MGNQSSQKQAPRESQFRGGLLDIEVRSTTINPREAITGIVNLTLAEPFPTNTLTLKLIGVEKTLILPAKRIAVPKDERRKLTQKIEFLKVNKTFSALGGADFRAGAYGYEFVMSINEPVPPSFVHSCTDKKQTFSCRLEYYLEAKLVSLKDNKTLKRRLPLKVVANERVLPGVNTAVSEHRFSPLVSFLTKKWIRMQIRTIDDFSDALMDIPVFIEIDATHSRASPINLTLQLWRTVEIKWRGKKAKCRSMVWEELITRKLQKGILYSKEAGLLVTVPMHTTQRLFETVNARTIFNTYSLRLVFEDSTASFMTSSKDKFVDVEYPVHLIRQQKYFPIPQETTCHNGSQLHGFNDIRHDPSVGRFLSLRDQEVKMVSRLAKDGSSNKNGIIVHRLPGSGVLPPSSARDLSLNRRELVAKVPEKVLYRATSANVAPRAPFSASKGRQPATQPRGGLDSEMHRIDTHKRPVWENQTPDFNFSVAPPRDAYPHLFRKGSVDSKATYPSIDSTNRNYFHYKKNEIEAFQRLNKAVY
jgi:hypothetical protein